ncbi:site-specific integrase [Modestobacter versicolor]|uniref:site-specific integrase n=1 Tax=Modestobacter versicolor TaxID=429133 RepID=UPI0034DE391A
MARPMMKVGEWGNIATTPHKYDEDGKARSLPKGSRKADTWRARAKVRDLDGKVRDVESWAKTEAAARRALTDKLRERVQPAPAHAAVKPTTKVKDAARVWLAELADSDRAVNTRQVYASTCNLHVIGTEKAPASLANLTVREVTAGGVERALTEIAKTSGPGAAKMTRTVLRGVLDMATKHDAIALNPVRSAGPISVRTTRKGTRDTERTFTLKEQEAVLAYAASDKVAQRRDLADLLAFLAGTGARIGEACGLRWSALDLAQGTAKLGPVVVREKGKGLHVQDDGKTDTSTRTIKLPADLVARLMSRQVNAPRNDWDVVFTSARGHLRDTSNTCGDVSEMLTAAGYPWATAHTFRHTVATTLDLAGLSAREIANHLGHKHASMTQDVYMSRRTISDRAAELLTLGS